MQVATDGLIVQAFHIRFTILTGMPGLDWRSQTTLCYKII